MAGTAIALALGLNAYSGFKQAQAQRDQANFQADQDQFNATMADLQAEDAIKRGDQDAINYRKQINLQKGSQVAGAASQGLDVNTGDAADLVAETERTGSLDILNIKSNAVREAFGYKAQAASMRGQSTMTRQAGEKAYTGTILTAGANALNTAGNYLAYKNNLPKKGNT